ncbi:MAG TPA: radical SAM protein [Armatimonadota bacterium]|nr:radical SAM protein [Armatimonadota bacterium]
MKFEGKTIIPNNSDRTWQPKALKLAQTGELEERARILRERLTPCHICPHACGVNRRNGEIGRCGVGPLARISSICDHRGEEPVLVGENGAGTVFVAGCNLKCIYCQNSQISQGTLDKYPEYSTSELADAFLSLQERGCHNLDWVSPMHVVPQLVDALVLAISRGLHLPIVYNTNGYDSIETLQLLDGIVDIYLPDLKYADPKNSVAFSSAPDYPEIALAAINEMYRQVGDLTLDEHDLARSGIIVRHLVLPNNLAGTREILYRLANEVSPSITVSLMAQYYPTHRAAEIPALSRTITADEYDDALDAFADAGLENGWAQEMLESQQAYRPDFEKEHPFNY